MPVLNRDRDGYTATVHQAGRDRAYRLSTEGSRFLTDLLGLRDGDEFRPSDLQLLIDRGWAVEQVAEPDPEPEPELVPPPAAKPRPPTTPRAVTARRTRGREIALQVLYQTEQNPDSDPAEVERFIDRRLTDQALRDYARELVEGVRSNQARIDGQITEVAENWRLDRMAAIDRNILRLGAYELFFREDVPRKVAINEALELAKRYSTAQSSRFVNGILDRLANPSPDPTPIEPPDESA